MTLLPRVFFFQAEDGIRDIGVTGVQTCALPISQPVRPPSLAAVGGHRDEERMAEGGEHAVPVGRGHADRGARRGSPPPTNDADACARGAARDAAGGQRDDGGDENGDRNAAAVHGIAPVPRTVCVRPCSAWWTPNGTTVLAILVRTPWHVGGMWSTASSASRSAAADLGRASCAVAPGTLRVMLWAPARCVWPAGTSQSSRPPIEVTHRSSGSGWSFNQAMNLDSSDIC